MFSIEGRSMKLELMTITPEMATSWLERASRMGYINRNTSRVTVDQYAKDMADGNWRVNGQTITLDSSSGIPLDGYHRLKACIQASVPFQTWIWYGVASDIWSVDTGRRRTLADVFRMAGHRRYCELAATVRRVWELENDGILTPAAPTHRQAMDLYESHREEFERAVLLAGSRTVPYLDESYSAALIYWTGACPEVLEFLEACHTGANLEPGHPALVLNTRLRKNKESHGKIPKEEKLALLFKAWNAYATNRKITSLRWRRYGSGGSGRGVEGFPMPLKAVL